MATSQKELKAKSKTCLIKVRVTGAEKALFQARANQFNEGNLSEYLRSAAISHRKKKRAP